MTGELIRSLDERYQTYLHDESGLRGEADSISFPLNEAEAAAIVAAMRDAGTPVTAQGGHTGLAGAAVPLRGHVMNLSRMNRIGQPSRLEDGTWVVTAEPGATLGELRTALAGARAGAALFWPPDPTETTATIGGVVSCGARGLTSMLYGDTLSHVESLRLLLRDGSVRDVSRGGGACCAGCSLGMLDVVAGGEGMVGVITQLTLRLAPKPRVVWGICFFCPDRQSTGAVADRLAATESGAGDASIACLEYLDRRSVALVEERTSGVAALRHLPDVDPSMAAAFFVELHGDDEDAVVALAGRLMDAVTECGGDPDAWVMFGEAEVERLRAMRHAAPESANMLVEQVRRSDPSILTLTTDMALPGLPFAAALDFYEGGLRQKGLDACLYGPVRDNRLYVTLLPRTRDEFVRGRRLVGQWAVRAVELGGRPVNEHGAGKLKQSLLAACPDSPRRRDLRRCKDALDPGWFWNPGTMF